jgi:hypothetical protein
VSACVARAARGVRESDGNFLSPSRFVLSRQVRLGSPYG